MRFAVAKVTVRCENTRQTSWWVLGQSCSHSQPGQRIKGGERKMGWTQNLSEFYELQKISNFKKHLLSLRVESCSLTGRVIPAITSRGRKTRFCCGSSCLRVSVDFQGKTFCEKCFLWEKWDSHIRKKITFFYIYVWFHGLPSNTVKINFHFDTQCLSESLIHFVNRWNKNWAIILEEIILGFFRFFLIERATSLVNNLFVR